MPSQPMEKISACVISFNDEHTIAWSVGSVQWADEIVVVDTGSTDRTIEIAERLGARVVRTAPFQGFGEIRARATAECRHEWILSLDSDEHCPPAAREEIIALLAVAAHDAYLVPRHNYFMGRLIRGSGWYRSCRTPQLFRKDRMRYVPSLTHESYELLSDRPVGRLENVFLHCPFHDLEEVLHKTNVISSLGARTPSNKPPSMWSALGHGLWAFARLYVLKGGFVDGWAGFIIALSNFEGTFYRYAKRYEHAHGFHLPAEAEQIASEKRLASGEQ
jgi:glycosyltransferase involved in cell wall biosynthesis